MRKLTKGDRGASAVGYALLVLVIAIVALIAIWMISPETEVEGEARQTSPEIFVAYGGMDDVYLITIVASSATDSSSMEDVSVSVVEGNVRLELLQETQEVDFMMISQYRVTFTSSSPATVKIVATDSDGDESTILIPVRQGDAISVVST